MDVQIGFVKAVVSRTVHLQGVPIKRASAVVSKEIVVLRWCASKTFINYSQSIKVNQPLYSTFGVLVFQAAAFTEAAWPSG